MTTKLLKEIVEKTTLADGTVSEKSTHFQLEILDENEMRIGEANIFPGGINVYCNSISLEEWKTELSTFLNR